MKSTSTDRLGVAFANRKMMVNKSVDKTENPEFNKEDLATNREPKCNKKKISKILIA